MRGESKPPSRQTRQAESSEDVLGEKKVIRATDAKEVGVENPAEETFCYPNRVRCKISALGLSSDVPEILGDFFKNFTRAR